MTRQQLGDLLLQTLAVFSYEIDPSGNPPKLLGTFTESDGQGGTRPVDLYEQIFSAELRKGVAVRRVRQNLKMIVRGPLGQNEKADLADSTIEEIFVSEVAAQIPNSILHFSNHPGSSPPNKGWPWAFVHSEEALRMEFSIIQVWQDPGANQGESAKLYLCTNTGPDASYTASGIIFDIEYTELTDPEAWQTSRWIAPNA